MLRVSAKPEAFAWSGAAGYASVGLYEAGLRMGPVGLDLDELLLDVENPRISKAGSQRDALQKIIEDQEGKLVVLAESIVDDGLNPMDRWLVIKSPDERGKFIVLEGNRRLAALKLLRNPAVMNDIEVPQPIKKKLTELAEDFDPKTVQPIACFEVADRSAANSWLTQRHTGFNNGRGIVDWSGMASARFRGRDPALQALDLVTAHGELSEDEVKAIGDFFPITTLDRLLSTPAVRQKIGVDIKAGKLTTDLPATEVIRPLRRIVLELATRTINVTKLKSKDQQVTYIDKLSRDLPKLSKRSGKWRPVDELGDQDFNPSPQKKKPKTKRKAKQQAVRRVLIPRECALSVTNPKIAEITRELRSLALADYPHSVSILFQIFLEQSVDHFLSAAGIPLDQKTGAGQKDKSLRQKVGEAIAEMVKNGTPKKNLAGVAKGIDDKQSPLYIETLHYYVHNRFYSPAERELRVAWDNAQPFFENIWK